jgi:putative tricarboxylic transport membrane protein
MNAKHWKSVLIVLIVSMIPLNGFAQAWAPTKPVEFVVGAGSGGGNDRTARVIQKILQDKALVPTPVVVVNKPGAGGVIAQDYLNTHSGDGHYIMVTNPAILTNPLTGVGAAKYTDATPVAQLFTEYVTLFVRANSPITSGRDAMERLRKDPGALSIAISPGPGTGTHIATALEIGRAHV